ncbi:hypothetical protein WEI85_06155 [Actinomycetes bacterium KLBMP 9797]
MPRIPRKVAVLAAMLTVTTSLATPAAARPPASPANSDVGAQSLELCEWIQERAACTNPTARLNLRTQPNTNSGIVTTMDTDSIVWVHCWTTGQSINGDNVWYWVDDASEGFTVNPIHWPKGWAAGYYLATGRDPHPWVAHC